MKMGMGIRGKLLAGILPFVIVALVVLTVISAMTGRSIISNQIHENMTSELEANARDVSDKLAELEVTGKDISVSISHVFGVLPEPELNAMIGELITSNENVAAASVWVEPYVAGSDRQFFAPFFYKTEDGKVEMRDVGGDGSYLQQDWYAWAKGQKEVNAMLLDPVYSEVTESKIIRCITPLYSHGNFIGAVTVAMSLEKFDELVSEIKVGDGADIAIITSSGKYVYSAQSERVENDESMTDMGDGLGAAATKLLADETGMVSYEGKDDTYLLYHNPVASVGWHFVSRVAESKVMAPVTNLVKILVIVCIIAVIICLITIFWQAGSMAKAVRRVEEFADELSSGDFTVDKIVTKRKDELGLMSHALNSMYDSNKDMIGRISHNSHQVHDSSESLHTVAQELHSRFNEIKENMSKVNDAMMSSSAATQEVSASFNEVNASVQKLSEETTSTDEHVKEIGQRAKDIQSHSSSAFANAKEIYNQRSEELSAASKKAEVVNEIGNLASAIADIADQINLLSLNASIEAARAGEHGKGFAVVASEINKLASETQEAVTQIQTTIDAVQDAFGDLSKSANDLLVFVNDTVTPDYESFVEVGEQYGKDAASFAELTADIMEMIGFIRESMDQVNAAVTNIAESTQDTASSSSEITETVSEVNVMVGDIGSMVSEQTEVAKDLRGIVTQYKL